MTKEEILETYERWSVGWSATALLVAALDAQRRIEVLRQTQEVLLDKYKKTLGRDEVPDDTAKKIEVNIARLKELANDILKNADDEMQTSDDPFVYTKQEVEYMMKQLEDGASGYLIPLLKTNAVVPELQARLFESKELPGLKGA